jgi:hypothetical protein
MKREIRKWILQQTLAADLSPQRKGLKPSDCSIVA